MCTKIFGTWNLGVWHAAEQCGANATLDLGRIKAPPTGIAATSEGTTH